MFNKSFTYFFPILYQDVISTSDIPYKYFFNNTLNSFYNSYCILETGKKGFVLVFKDLKKDDLFIQTIEEYEYIAKIDTKDDYTIYYFNINNRCIDCYIKFLKGKYSKISDTDKTIITTFMNRLFYGIKGGKEMYMKVSDILYKNPTMINKLQTDLGLSYYDDEWELSSRINTKDETFNLELL